MDIRADFDEEVVAGSEDDEVSFQPGLFSHPGQHDDRAGKEMSSPKSPTRPSKNAESSTTKGSAGSSSLPGSSSDRPVSDAVTTAPRPRPRPRPAYNGAPGFSSDTSAPVDAMLSLEQCKAVPDDFPSSAAEPVKARSRKAIVAPVDDAPVQQSKKQALPEKCPSTSKCPVFVSTVIEITSDEEEYDELALRSPPSTKSKPSKQLEAKSVRTKKPPKRNKVSYESPKPSERPTVEIMAHTPYFNENSSLPPSSAALGVQEIDHPPIAVLPNDFDDGVDLDFDTTHPPSSPPVLVGPSAMKGRKKRKLAKMESFTNDGADDEIDWSQDNASASRMRIPPTKGTPSTTSPGVSHSRNAPRPQAKLSSKARGKRKATADDEWDEANDVRVNPRPKAKRGSKPKQDRKARNGGERSDPMENVRGSSNSKDRPIQNQDTEDGQVQIDRNDAPIMKNVLAPETSNGVTDNPMTIISSSISPSLLRSRGNAKKTIVSDDEDLAVSTDKNERKSGTTGQATSSSGTEKKMAQEEFTDGSKGDRDEDTEMKENFHPNLDSQDTTKWHESSSFRPSCRAKSTPMSELIRRVNSLPGSRFCSSPSLSRSRTGTPSATAYSPYAKSSRSVLSRIAPLHPNRRTPPPPLPRPPPPKKTKKQLEQEEKWEEELSESVEGWACLTDEERAALRRVKRAQEEGWEE